MAGFKWDKFGGIRPLATDLRLGANEAVFAAGVDFRRGVLRPQIRQRVWNALYDPYVTLADGDDVPASLFRFRDRSNNDEYWMYWETDVDVAPGPVENDQQRHYYTGDGVPKMFTKESITDTTPPYPEPADTKFPKTWYFLGVPAPAAAPTIDGTSYVPPDTAKSGVISGVHAPHVIIRFNPRRGHRGTDILRSEGNGVSTDPSGDTHMDSDGGAMVMEVMLAGTRVKVTEIIDANQVRVVGTVGSGCFEKFGDNYDDPVPDNRLDERWTWDEDEIATLPFEDISFTKKVYRRINGKNNDICWTYHVPDSAVLQVAGHSLKVGDVVRVVSATEPMTWSTPTRVRVGPRLFAGDRGRQRPFYNTADATVEFEGELTYFVERDGREFDPTIEDVVVDSREPTTRSYVYTYVTALGEEGPPSAPTDPFTIALGDSVTIEGFTAPPTAHRDIVTFRLYRTNTGTQETAFQFVADIPIASTEYEDSLTDDELGEVLQSETWEPPPADMVGICAMPNGFLAGFFENVLCFSEPGFPHAWPVEYRMPLENKVMAIKVIGGALIVATRGAPYVVSGTHPRQMASRREEESAPCVDKRSMADCGDIAIYASTDGLIAGSPSGFRNLTSEFYTREQWLAIVGKADAPTRTVRGWYVSSQYLLTTVYTDENPSEQVDNDHTLFFDFRDPNRLNIVASYVTPIAAFNDPTDGELYYLLAAENDGETRIVDNESPPLSKAIFRWDYFHPESIAGEPETPGEHGDGSSGSITSGIVMFQRPMAPSVVRVVCRRIETEAANYYYGRLFFRLIARPYRTSNEQNDFGGEVTLCEFDLIRGDSTHEDYIGEQRSQPFRLPLNMLVDGMYFAIDFTGIVEVESICVAESFDDLLALEAQ